MKDLLSRIMSGFQRVWRTHAGRYSLYGALAGLGIAAGLFTVRFVGTPREGFGVFFHLEPFRLRGPHFHTTLAAVAGFLLLGGWMGRRIDRMQRRVEKFKDVSEALRSLSRTDELTGVLSRRALLERLEEEIKRAERYGTALSCLFIDVDDFKRMNEERGHPFGDRALAAIARAMGRHIRGTDVIGRYGGDEFLILLPHAGLAQAYLVTERVRKGVASLEVDGGGKGEITISVGLFVSLLGASTAAEFLEGADEALRRSKSAGKNRTVVHEHPSYVAAARRTSSSFDEI